jgi:folate-dependent phosphoribosylglycinamide formyltransferase PurN
VNIVVLTNDNLFSFVELRGLLELRKQDIKLVVFSSALIGEKGPIASIMRCLKNTGFRYTFFKLMIYGVFRALRVLCKLAPFVPNHYSSYLWAARNGVKSVVSGDINAAETVAQIRSANPDLIVSVSMNQIVKEDILTIPPKGCINGHSELLPRYGGMSPYVWTLANGEECSGSTVHYMTRGLDEGDIISQSKVDICDADSAFALLYRCCLKESELLIKAVDDIEAGSVTTYPQDMSRRTYFSWPTRECVRALRKNGYKLGTVSDFLLTIFGKELRVKQ